MITYIQISSQILTCREPRRKHSSPAVSQPAQSSIDQHIPVFTILSLYLDVWRLGDSSCSGNTIGANSTSPSRPDHAQPDQCDGRPCFIVRRCNTHDLLTWQDCYNRGPKGFFRAKIHLVQRFLQIHSERCVHVCGSRGTSARCAAATGGAIDPGSRLKNRYVLLFFRDAITAGFFLTFFF